MSKELFTAVRTTYQSKLTFGFYIGKHIPKNLTKKSKKSNNKQVYVHVNSDFTKIIDMGLEGVLTLQST